MTDPNPTPNKDALEDKRLERLFDYTKWHISIYLSFGAGLVGLLGSRDGNSFVCKVIAVPWLMGMALGAMVIAGIAGGVVASAATRSRTFDELWRYPVYRRPAFTGESWASVEHSAFWLSLLLIAASVLYPAPRRQDCSAPPADAAKSP
jgi:hypothetical protein